MSVGLADGRAKRKLLIMVTAVTVGAALTWYVKNYVSLEDLVAQEERVREAIDRRPWRSFALGLAIYSLVPGTSGKSIVFAWLFGFWQGVALIIFLPFGAEGSFPIRNLQVFKY